MTKIVYSKYDTATGEIVARIKRSVGPVNMNKPGYALIEGNFDPATQYIVAGEAVNRPEMQITQIHGVGTLEVSGLPEGAEVLVQGTAIDEIDATGIFADTIAEDTTYSFVLWPYRPKIVHASP